MRREEHHCCIHTPGTELTASAYKSCALSAELFPRLLGRMTVLTWMALRDDNWTKLPQNLTLSRFLQVTGSFMVYRGTRKGPGNQLSQVLKLSGPDRQQNQDSRTLEIKTKNKHAMCPAVSYVMFCSRALLPSAQSLPD